MIHNDNGTTPVTFHQSPEAGIGTTICGIIRNHPNLSSSLAVATITTIVYHHHHHGPAVRLACTKDDYPVAGITVCRILRGIYTTPLNSHR